MRMRLFIFRWICHFWLDNVLQPIPPRVFLPVETELWPNFLKTARQIHVPVMMVNEVLVTAV